MKKITKFEAIDGKEFNDEDECLKHESLIAQVDRIMSFLPSPPKDDSCDFVNGKGFIQHNGAILRNAQIQLLELCKEYIDHKWVQNTIDDATVHPSYVGRLLGDYDIRPLYTAWNRFECIDRKKREWGQPYYAKNPQAGVMVQVN